MSAGMIPPGISLISRIIGAMGTLIVGLLLVPLLLWLAADPGDHRHPSGQEQKRQMNTAPEGWGTSGRNQSNGQPEGEDSPLSEDVEPWTAPGHSRLGMPNVQW